MCAVKLITAYGAVNNLIIASCLATRCSGGVFNNGCTCYAIGKLLATNCTVVRLFGCCTIGKLLATNSTVVRAFCCCTIGNLFTANGTVVRVFSCLALGKLFAANVTVVIVVITVSALACHCAAVLTNVRVCLLCVCSLCDATAVVANVILRIKVGMT